MASFISINLRSIIFFVISLIVSLHKDLRMWGVQGYDSASMDSKVTKYHKQVLNPKDTIKELEKAFFLPKLADQVPVGLI